MKTHFWADPHLSHDGILGITFRNFPTIEEHNGVVLEELNSRVGDKDRLIVLGDVCWRAEETWMSQIRCKNRYLIVGNHDKAKLGKMFMTAEDVAEFKIQGHKIFCSHYPHAYWPASHHGSLHLYGHTHAQRERTLDDAFPGRRAMDVGVDNAFRLFGQYRPFTEDEVIAILMARPGHDQIAFYEWFQAKRKEMGTVEFNRYYMNEPWTPPQ